VTAAALLSGAPIGQGAERGRARSHEIGIADALWAAAPTVAVDVTACPEVTTPEATVARFSVLPLPIIATVVDVRVTHAVALSRIGGLYGP
jgi:hypothetical protein